MASSDAADRDRIGPSVIGHSVISVPFVPVEQYVDRDESVITGPSVTGQSVIGPSVSLEHVVAGVSYGQHGEVAVETAPRGAEDGRSSLPPEGNKLQMSSITEGGVDSGSLRVEIGFQSFQNLLRSL